MRNLALGKPYTVTNPVNDAVFLSSERGGPWADKGGQLTNGKIGPIPMLPGSWVGFTRQLMRTVTVDLQERDTVQTVTAHFAQDPRAGVTVPVAVTVLGSDDGASWHLLGTVQSPVAPSAPGPQAVAITWKGKVTARYIRLEFPVAVWALASDITVSGIQGPSAQGLPPRLQPAPQPDLGYLSPRAAGGVGSMLLCYLGPLSPTGPHTWRLTSAQWLPLIAHIGTDSKPDGWFFDSALLLMNGQSAPSGGNFSGATTRADWSWWLQNLFGLAPGGQADTQLPGLQAAVAQAGAVLSDPAHQVNVVIAIPYPKPGPSAWAPGVPLQDPAGRLTAVQWFISQTLADWKQADFKNLHLAGFYWYAESLQPNPGEVGLLQQAAATIHQDGLRFYWIPYFGATAATAWKALGFDGAYLQPNYEFQPTATPQRLTEAAAVARHWGLGLEMELGSLNYSDESVPRYLTYLNAGAAYGYQGASSAYYDSTQLLLAAAGAAASSPERAVYDLTYAFVRGSYQAQYVGPGVTLPPFAPIRTPPGIVNALPPTQG